jgi:hypothetical protein
MDDDVGSEGNHSIDSWTQGGIMRAPKSVGRTATGVVASMVLLAAILAFLPAPLQIIAALIALPIGASIFAGTGTLSRRRL